MERLVYYGKHTTIHGLKYVADEKRHPLIRLAWIVVFVLSFYGMILVFMASYRSSMENAISFVTETAYLNWNTSFPAVTLCEISSTAVAWDEQTEESEMVEQFLTDVIFFTGSCYSCSLQCATCQRLKFQEVVQKLYFHAREDVPFINSDPDQRKDVMLGETYNISINVIEIENDENVKSLSVEKRGCRFPEEKPDDLVVHDYYSYSTCVVQCHADAHLELCNCTHHLMPILNKGKYCDIDGLKCLTDNYETVNRLHAKGFDKPGLVCDCLPSCVEPEYKVVASTKGVKTSHSEISLRMQSLPTSRFKRVVVRTRMDLVVSIGGSAGLFIGASLLSIVETIYLLFIRRKATKNK